MEIALIITATLTLLFSIGAIANMAHAAKNIWDFSFEDFGNKMVYHIILAGGAALSWAALTILGIIYLVVNYA